MLVYNKDQFQGVSLWQGGRGVKWWVGTITTQFLMGTGSNLGVGKKRSGDKVVKWWVGTITTPLYWVQDQNYELRRWGQVTRQ